LKRAFLPSWLHSFLALPPLVNFIYFGIELVDGTPKALFFHSLALFSKIGRASVYHRLSRIQKQILNFLCLNFHVIPPHGVSETKYRQGMKCLNIFNSHPGKLTGIFTQHSAIFPVLEDKNFNPSLIKSETDSGHSGHWYNVDPNDCSYLSKYLISSFELPPPDDYQSSS
jgi:hypothetical protein